MTAVLVALAGGLGATLRFTVDAVLRMRRPAMTPWQTSIINISGAFLVGVAASLPVAGAAGPYWVGVDWHAVAVVGFCGGYTTMSAASVDLLTLLSERRYAAGAAYATFTALCALVACALGLALGKALV